MVHSDGTSYSLCHIIIFFLASFDKGYGQVYISNSNIIKRQVIHASICVPLI